MPREWRFGERSAAWPSGCAKAEPPRLSSRVADAFVDRAPIDWPSLLARAGSGSERALIETLRSIDAIRGDASDPSASIPPARWRPRFAAAVLAVASLQTATAVGAVAIAFLAGEPAAWRPSRLVAAFAFAVVSLLFGVVTRGDRRSLWLVATMAAGASAFSRAALAGTLPASSALAVGFRGVYPEAFVPALLWQFAAEFPRGARFTRLDDLARRAASSAWLLGAALLLANLAVAYGIPAAVRLERLQRDDPGNLFWHLFAIACLPAIATVLARGRRAAFAERRRVARFAAAVALGGAPLLVSGVIRLLVPPIDAWFASAGADRAWFDTVVMSTLAAAPVLSFTVAVLDRPFVRPSGPRGSPARAPRIVLTAILIAPFGALTILLYSLRQTAIAGVAADLRVWLLFGLAACGYALLRRGRLLDRLAGVAQDRDERLAAAMEQVRLARGPREISDAVTRAVRDGTAASARMLVRHDDGAFADASGSGLTLRRETALVQILEASPVALDVSPDQPAHALLPHADRDWLTGAGASVVAPLARRDGTLLAVLVAGARSRGEPFGRRDRWLLTALMAAAAAAWESTDELRADEDAALECPACGVVAAAARVPCACAAQPAVAALPALVAGKFVVERRVGAGAMGVVYVARDRTLGRAVALKTLPRLRGRNATRLGDEARAMAALNHDALATLYGLELWRGTPVMVVEYFPDGTLARRLRAGPVPPAMAIDFGSRLAAGLAYMHERGVLHRDVKPSNIGITPAGLPKLLDFGLAMLMRSEEARNPPAAGTPAYVAPDALDGATPAPAFDLWALSVVLLEMITGRNPFAAARPGRAFAGAKRQVAAACPELLPFFERALARRAADRFQSAGALRDALVNSTGRR